MCRKEFEQRLEVAPLSQEVTVLHHLDIHPQMIGEAIFFPRRFVDAHTTFVTEQLEEGLREGTRIGFNLAQNHGLCLKQIPQYVAHAARQRVEHPHNLFGQ